MPTLVDAAVDRADGNGPLHETILVVDDQRSIRDLMGEILQRAGYHVLTAGNAGEARLAFEDWPVDLVISDIQMPGTDGAHLVEQLRSDHPEVKCILMSAGTSPAARRGVLFLSKPFSLYQLLERVAEALGA